MYFTAYVTAVLAIILTALSLNVSRLRIKHNVSYGDGGVKPLTVGIRVHGNSLEQSLLFIFLLFFVEQAGLVTLTQGLGVSFVVVRLLYIWALLGKQHRLRQVSHTVTLVIQLVAAFSILSQMVA
ncbi:MAPEG family protein [Hahella ganghwensis]|uniref:MAPEG family protein n=1 Tax=Hahella ganghwensis TaxID=286420 RepID=UPI000381684A|nr:MAPEG family protein [Hahella ganghwensis]